MVSTRKKLLIVESNGFSPEALQILSEVFEICSESFDRKQLLERISNYHFVWVRLGIAIDTEVLDAAERLEVIATNTTGLNHIDLAAAAERNIQVVSLKGESTFLREIRATAEHTVALCLSLLRKIPEAHQHCLDGNWNRTLFQGSEIHRKTVGVIGYGRLGSIVASYFRAFDAKVIVHSLGLSPGETIDGFPCVRLEQLTQQSDIVTLHADYRSENSCMIGRDQFASMKSSAVFINTARGELVDESALCWALRSGQIAGAAIDVLTSEQSRRVPPQELIRIAGSKSNLLLTPHIAGNTAESLSKTEIFLAEKLCSLESK